MDRLIEEIRAASRANMFMLALQGSLALIDVCAALEAPNGETTGPQFRRWFGENLGHRYQSLEAGDVYKLRCGMLHQGRMRSKQYDYIAFILPDGRNNRWGEVRVDNTLHVDLVEFCAAVTDAAEAWWEQKHDSEPMRSNAERLARIRPEGMPPQVVGLAVIA